MAQLITVRLNKADHQPLGFRLQGGKDFGTPLVVQKVNVGSAAERAGLLAGDALIRVNNTDVYTLRHQEAQDTIRATGPTLELTVQRGGSTWRPSVTPTGSLPRPSSRPLSATPAPVTTTSLKSNSQPSRAFGSGHNNVAKPFGYMNGNEPVKSIVNKQYNTPVNMYSDQTIAETLSAQTEVLAGGVLGVNFKKNEKTYDAEKSAVYKVLQEAENDPEPEVSTPGVVPPVSGLRHVQAPVTRPDAPINNTGGLPPGQNICEECERLITGVFVRIKDKNLHVECFKCSTCGTSLKNQGYYNINGKLYCDIHAKLVARQNPPAPNLEPVTVAPGARIPTNAYSTPLPPLSTNNYTNGPSSLFSPSSNLSGPKPFGSSLGSTYSPSLSPRSAPLSPARPVAAPAPAPGPPLAHAHAPAPFAPTKNVKSVVWPPPNPPEDEPSKEFRERDMSPKTACKEPVTTGSWMENKINSGLTQHFENVEEKSVQQRSCLSSQQTSEFHSTASYESASMATASASSKTESIMQSNQSQETREMTSCSIQAFSTQSSSKSQNMIIYESQIPSISTDKDKYEKNKAFDESTEKNLEIKEKLEKDNKQESAIHETKKKNIELHEKQNIKEILISENICTAQGNIKNINEDKNINLETPIKSFQSSSVPNSVPHMVTKSMINALTIAPDRPYSPLSTSSLPLILPAESKVQNQLDNPQLNSSERKNVEVPSQPSPIFSQQPKRGITPIPPIKTYNPPEKKEPPVSLPPETKPYIPPDFKINVESKVLRPETSSPLVEALTTVPDRPFTPTKTQTIERGSLKEALTIAPDRPFSPLSINMKNQSDNATSTIYLQPMTSEIIRPIATQTTTKLTNQINTEFSNVQNSCSLQSSSETSAFRPIGKQVYPSPPDQVNHLGSFPPISNELKSNFDGNRVKYGNTETMLAQHATATSYKIQGFSSVKSGQNYFEQLDKKETLSSTAVRSKSGLHKPDHIPSYQKNIEMLPSQRGITPELCNAPAYLQRPVTPTTDPPVKPRDRSQTPHSDPNIAQVSVVTAKSPTNKIPQIKTPVENNPALQFQNRQTPISMTFQPVTHETYVRASPGRSRPTTPSLINKPAPIVPHYQMNLVSVEHSAPESYLYQPSSPEISRSPTPKPRSRSPAQGPPPNPLKAHAPRIKDVPSHTSQTLLSQATSNLRKEHEIAQNTNSGNAVSTSRSKNQIQSQPSVITEQVFSNVGYKNQTYDKGDLQYKEDSVINQNYGQRQMQSRNVSEYGNTTVKTTRKTYEEFERTQSAKVIEIRKGGSASSDTYQKIESNIQPSNIIPKQVFSPPITSVSTSYSAFTNKNVADANNKVDVFQPNPSTSGANQGPVCDPTPSTGSSVGAAARGKTFGVSSAPKRGRGILNKAALPGSRVPLCASCNGNIRGPFITALGRIWCPEHFICVNATCRRPLQDIGFVEENGQLYCEFCFEQYIAPACDKCHAKIKGDCLNAIGKHFHPECFNCVYCGKLFGNNPFFLEDSLPYCEADWNELFTTKCFACGFPVEAGDRWVEALNNNYHSQCFNCTVCKKNLEGQSFFAKGGRPFCKVHAR